MLYVSPSLDGPQTYPVLLMKGLLVWTLHLVHYFPLSRAVDQYPPVPAVLRGCRTMPWSVRHCLCWDHSWLPAHASLRSSLSSLLHDINCQLCLAWWRQATEWCCLAPSSIGYGCSHPSLWSSLLLWPGFANAARFCPQIVTPFCSPLINDKCIKWHF